jgi:hypothetical protein
VTYALLPHRIRLLRVSTELELVEEDAIAGKLGSRMLGEQVTFVHGTVRKLVSELKMSFGEEIICVCWLKETFGGELGVVKFRKDVIAFGWWTVEVLIGQWKRILNRQLTLAWGKWFRRLSELLRVWSLERAAVLELLEPLRQEISVLLELREDLITFPAPRREGLRRFRELVHV